MVAETPIDSGSPPRGARRLLRRVGARRPHLADVALAAGAVAVGTVVGGLVASGLWYAAAVLALAVPGFVVLQRAPLVGLVVWLAIVPTVYQLTGPTRYAFFLAHRAIPIAAVGLIVLDRALGARDRARLPRLGFAEVMMVGYLVVTVLSVLYTSLTVTAALADVYDRIVVPMFIYLLIRLANPGASALRAAAPALLYVLVFQLLVGAASWLQPGVLPVEWLNRAGTRTVGSLSSPSLYGVTMGLTGLLVLQIAAGSVRRWVRDLGSVAFVLAVTMMLLTFTRGVWLAAAVVVAVGVWVHGRLLLRVVPLLAVALAVLAMTGLMGGVLDRFQERADTEETAQARLPLAIASLAMFEERPLTGWGVGNFERFDRDFQRSVGDYVPEKDHASHNRYLRMLAEQGIVGSALFAGPVLYWLVRWRKAWRYIPRSGVTGRGLTLCLWAVLAGHVLVSNFSDMDTSFGNGHWWAALGLIGAQVHAATTPTFEPAEPGPAS